MEGLQICQSGEASEVKLCKRVSIIHKLDEMDVKTARSGLHILLGGICALTVVVFFRFDLPICPGYCLIVSRDGMISIEID
ncbi:hypothetical protein RJ639_047512 [Escallonia herrerae]|uniref:Uncharacterized protein n=1 Tax=Escallonia herrerae TaxID=1293975 RepID=A0AA88W8B8_9ASTE|nr:hypothetical protein RJ639_047512 [Escallonia herrerae]